MLVLHNFDLAFAIVQEYRLPTQRIYQSALVVMATKKETKKIDELLKMVRPWLNENEWDDIVLAGIKGALLRAISTRNFFSHDLADKN